MRETEFFPVQDRDQKLQIEATPGFTPSMYQFLNNGEINRRGLVKHVQVKELQGKGKRE